MQTEAAFAYCFDMQGCYNESEVNIPKSHFGKSYQRQTFTKLMFRLTDMGPK